MLSRNYNSLNGISPVPCQQKKESNFVDKFTDYFGDRNRINNTMGKNLLENGSHS
jgi:hypothetical protein